MWYNLNMNKDIRILITGGTIDCKRINPKTKEYFYEETHLPEILKQARHKCNPEMDVLMMKDSIFMNDEDREKILKECKSCKEDRIVITHGTDTMTDAATFLGKRIKNKIIVLIGAIIPFNQNNSDALFNLGSALTAAQLLDKNGVYITMNGEIYTWDNVVKNKEQERFERKVKLKS